MTVEYGSRIRLADALSELRAEISRARREGEGKDVRFASTSIEVELFVEFSVEGQAAVGVPNWVPIVDLSAQGSGQRGGMHRIKMVLEIDASGSPSERVISDDEGPRPIRNRKR